MVTKRMMEKNYRNYWNSKDLKMGLGIDKNMVAIGEEFGYNGFRYIHFKTEDFINFANDVVNEIMDDNNLIVKMNKEDLEYMLNEFEVPRQLVSMLENPPDGVSIAKSVSKRLSIYQNLKKQYDNLYKS